MAKILTSANQPKEKGSFLAGAGAFAMITALGSTMGTIGGALGSVIGGYVGSKIAKGKSEKFIISGLGYINGADFVISGLIKNSEVMI